MTKKFAFLFLLNIVFLHFSYSQNYNSVDKIVLKYPKKFDTTEELAEKIQKDFTSEKDKARAIYSWIAFNVDYNLNEYLNPSAPKSFSYRTEAEKQQKIQLLNDKILEKAFKSHKAVCEGYTLLYHNLASLVGLKSEIIRGDSKTRLEDIGRKKTTSNHAWNTVLIDGKWRLIDVTWGQGYYDDRRGTLVKEFTSIYFDADPDYFFTKHFPDSGTYLGDKLDKDDFLNGPLIYNKTIEGDNKIMAPKSGMIEARSGEKIKFQIKNISKTDQLFYLNKKNQPVKVEEPKEKKGGLEFQITVTKNIGDYITFFLNGNSIVSFKIVSK